MKNLYLEKMKVLSVAAVLLLCGVSVSAQTVTWTGEFGTDADNINNWKDPSSFVGKNVVVGHVGEYYDPANPQHPVTTAEGDVNVLSLTVKPQTTVTVTDPNTQEQTSTTYVGGQFTIAKPKGSKFNIGVGSSYYLDGMLIVQSGTLTCNKDIRLQPTTAHIIVEEDGIVDIGSRNFYMGNSTLSSGGKVTVRGNGQWHSKTLERVTEPEKGSLITISDNGVFSVAGDIRTFLKSLVFTKKQVVGGAGFSPYFYYESLANRTYTVVKSIDKPFIYTTDHMPVQVTKSTSNTLLPEICVLRNEIIDNALGFTWKYGTNETGPYDQVLSGFTNDTIKPIFTGTGTFFLVCEVTKEDGSKVESTPIKYIIATDKISLTPDNKQFLRLGQIGAPVIATETGTVSVREWKYSTESGANYMSFSPVESGAVIEPKFPATGTYYLICESTIDGVVLQSKEVEILVQANSAGAINVTWTGAYNDDFSDIRNWQPLAYPHKNNAMVPASATVWPIFKSGVDTIMTDSNIAAGAKLYIRAGENDTLTWRGEAYGLVGELIVESGVFLKEDTYLRMTSNTSTLRVTGTGVAVFKPHSGYPSDCALSMANNDAFSAGGQIYVSGNGKVYFTPANIHRMPTSSATTIGKFYIEGNGQYIFNGDAITKAAVYNGSARFVFNEGYVYNSVYDYVTNWTYVSARDVNGFSITQTKTQFVGPDQLTSELSLTNAASLSGFEWQYSSSPFGPWNSFATPVTGETAKVSFPAGGTYFVACKASDGTYTNNVLRVRVVDLPITVTLNEQNEQVLTVTLPTGVTGLEWKFRTESETVYQDFGLAAVTATVYTPNVIEYPDPVNGTYYVVYEATVSDDDAQPVTIQSKPVQLVITNGVIGNISTAVPNVKVEQLSIYPNPTAGTFFVNAVKGGSVSVTDVKGAVVLNQVLSAGQQSVTLSAKGVYVVKVVDGTQVKIGRVVVK